jgi:RNA polymerase sigma factor (sigma-70 family)
MERFFKQGDRAAMATLFDRHKDAAYRIALGETRNSADAEDVVQTAFLTVMSKGVHVKSNLRGWIMSVVVSTCRDRMKAEFRRRARQDTCEPQAEVMAADAEQAELLAASLRSVQNLPAIYRRPVMLHFLEGFAVEEVACALSLPETTVRSQVRRGLEQVRESLAAAGFTASAAALPAVLALSALPAAPAALTASLKTLAASGALKVAAETATAARGMAAKGIAASTIKLLIVAVLVAAGAGAVATGVYMSRNSHDAQPMAGAPLAATDAIETKGDSKAPAKGPAAWPAGKTVGWRNDGTGHYPDATPPTSWSLSEKGESKNIAWKTKLPCYSWSSPIVVGEKIFTRSEPYDLICLNRKEGKLLWIQSHPPIIAVTDEEKKANPAFKEIELLVPELQKINDGFVTQGWTPELYKQKYDIQKKINELTAKADKKYALPPDMYVESWTGYTAATPCSDGEFVYINSGDGITACYDLNGNRKWLYYEQVPRGTWSEHGHGESPVLVKDVLYVPIPGDCVVAFNKKTGAQIWRKQYDYKVFQGQQSAIIPFTLGGNDYASAWGNFISLKDGKSFRAIPYVNVAPVLDNNILYFIHSSGRTMWYKMDAPASGELTATPVIKLENDYFTFPLKDESKRWDIENCYWNSPLYHNGLLYAASTFGNLSVMDTFKAALVYQQQLPLDFKNPKSRKSTGMGMGASPALGGKYIYFIDSANCTLVLEPGREYKQIAKNNIDYTVQEGWEPGHYIGPHHEQTEASLVFDGNRIYIRGEQFLYCVSEGGK